MKLLMFLLKGGQIQAGASWDNVTAIAVGLLLVGGVALVVALTVSRLAHTARVRRRERGARRGRGRKRSATRS